MWNDVDRLSGENPNVWKYVFKNGEAVAEAVLYRYPTFEARTVICCSTQSGCPVGCRFCGAGDYFVRSLKSDQIVAQVDHLMVDQTINPANVDRMQIMFMSMGEPLLNYKNLRDALYVLHEKYPKSALLISTIGPDVPAYDDLIEDSMKIPKVGLQFSVHESTDEKRNALIPFKKKLSLVEIAAEGVRWATATGRRPFFNYCAHEGNTSDEDVERLTKILPPEIWECTVSVVCEREEHVAAAHERQREQTSSFMGKMMSAGYSTRVFNPAGQDDIGGGCGQLWYVQQWMRDNPQLAKPSVGRELPVFGQ